VIEHDRRDVWWVTPPPMMKKTGPSYAVEPQSSKQDYSVERNQCLCADAKWVFVTTQKEAPSPLTRPTSLGDVENGAKAVISASFSLHCKPKFNNVQNVELTHYVPRLCGIMHLENQRTTEFSTIPVGVINLRAVNASMELV
jgi:hypothetical protein